MCIYIYVYVFVYVYTFFLDVKNQHAYDTMGVYLHIHGIRLVSARGALLAMSSRLRRQNQMRQTHVDWIVKKIAKRLKSKGHIERMMTTNRVLPVGTLKRKIIRKLFAGWIRQYVGEGRVLTLKLAKQVVAALRKKIFHGKTWGGTAIA